MKTKNKNIIVFSVIILIAIITGLYFSYQNNNSLYRVLKNEGIDIDGLKNFKISDDSFKEYTHKERDLYAKKNEDEIKIKIVYNMEGEQVKKYIKDQKVILASLYEPTPPPYPEFIGVEVSCDKKYKPVLKETARGEYYLLYAGERKGYGVCEENMVKYKVLLGYFNYGDKLLKIEYFSPNKSFQEIEGVVEGE